MIKIEATTTIEELSRALSSLGREQLPFALALAATRTAQLIRKGELAVMRQRLDNPISTTMNSLFLKSATKRKPEATVWFKDAWGSGIPADQYMRPAVYGGQRKHKRFEKALIARGLMKSNQYAMPTPALKDSNGNVKGAQIIRILSGLGAAETVSGYQANATKSRRSLKKGNAQRYFVGTIDGVEGVWERKATAMGDAVRPLFYFQEESSRYRVKVPFFKIADNMVKANYEREFTTALDHAIKTAKPKG